MNFKFKLDLENLKRNFNKYILPKEERDNVYNSECIIIYITLLGEKKGKIRKISRNFLEYYNVKQLTEVID